jgi:hypothetical protein
MQNQALIITLTLLMNTASGLLTLSAFKQGSVAFFVCSVAFMAISNTLALFGRPAVVKFALPGEIAKVKADTEEPKV